VLALFALCVAHPRRSQADEPTADIPPTDGPSKQQPRSVPIVAPGAVTKISGEVPMMKVEGVSDDRADVLAKLCIDERGKVTTVKLIKAAPEIVVQLEHALSAWRYRPYTNSAGALSPICFPVSFSVMPKPDRPKNAGAATKQPPAKAPPAAAPQPAPKSPKKQPLRPPSRRPTTPPEPDLE
jgi:hypothetical protein